jgi:hypothetical protein
VTVNLLSDFSPDEDDPVNAIHGPHKSVKLSNIFEKALIGLGTEGQGLPGATNNLTDDRRIGLATFLSKKIHHEIVVRIRRLRVRRAAPSNK